MIKFPFTTGRYKEVKDQQGNVKKEYIGGSNKTARRIGLLAGGGAALYMNPIIDLTDIGYTIKDKLSSLYYSAKPYVPNLRLVH